MKNRKIPWCNSDFTFSVLFYSCDVKKFFSLRHDVSPAQFFINTNFEKVAGRLMIFQVQ